MNPKEAAAGSEGHDRCRVPIHAYTAHTIRTTLKLQESWAAVSYNLYTF